MGRAENCQERGLLQAAVELVELAELRKRPSVSAKHDLKQKGNHRDNKSDGNSLNDFRQSDAEERKENGSFESAVVAVDGDIQKEDAGIGVVADDVMKFDGNGNSAENSDLAWQKLAEQEEAVRVILNEQEVDIEALRQIVWENGLPDGELRASAWRVMCGYVGEVRSRWEETLTEKRAEYWKKVDELMTRPGASSSEAAQEKVEIDHPLNVAEDSGWNLYFKDGELRDEIGKDVDRTHPGHELFETQVWLREALARILFVWAKEKGGALGYRQGMHELAAVVLLVFANSSVSGTDSGHLEADTYWCFEFVMRNARDCYLEQGVVREMGRLGALLKIKDPGLEAHLEKIEVDVRFWGLRWMRLWLVREFSVSRAIQVWDILLCAEDISSWLRYLCVAICIIWRDKLLKADFGNCVGTLLGGVDLDICKIVDVADRLRQSNVVYRALVNKGPPPAKDL